ncbi:MAG TPA: hypothetical protein VF403_19610 [Kofleriaceae bacterium]
MSALRPLLSIALFGALFGACGDDSARHIVDSPLHQPQVAPGIYLTDINNSIIAFSLDATGDAAPFRTITGPTTMLSLPIGLTVDHDGDVYVANRTGSSVTVYGPTATGDVAPIRSLTATGMGSPEGLVRGANDDIYATTCPTCGNSAGGDIAIYHFPHGSTTSDYTIAGPATGLTAPSSPAIDAAGNFYIANSFGGSISTFAPGATGEATPMYTFTPSASYNIQSMSVLTHSIAVTVPGTGIVLFDAQATGTASPIGTIDGATFSLGYPGGIFIDTSVTPTLIYVADFGAASIHVLEMAGTEPNLTVSAMHTIAGPTTTLSQPLDIVVVH